MEQVRGTGRNRRLTVRRHETELVPNRVVYEHAGPGSSEGAMTSPLLSVRAVKAYYGHIAALKGVDVDVGEGEIVALIGANGAGKSTLMMTIFGKPRARAGQIQFDGRDITDVPTPRLARLRIAQAPEGPRISPRTR